MLLQLVYAVTLSPMLPDKLAILPTTVGVRDLRHNHLKRAY